MIDFSWFTDQKYDIKVMEMVFQLNMDPNEFCKVADGIVNEQHTNAHLIVTKHKKCMIKFHYLLH